MFIQIIQILSHAVYIYIHMYNVEAIKIRSIMYKRVPLKTLMKENAHVAINKEELSMHNFFIYLKKGSWLCHFYYFQQFQSMMYRLIFFHSSLYYFI